MAEARATAPGPLEAYRRLEEAGEVAADDAQLMALGHLSTLRDELLREPPAKPSLLGRMLGRSPPQRQTKGLYFWGGVGRGKTFVMDLFFDALPFEDKLRLHFHRFMQRVHRDLKGLAGTSNPLDAVAARFADESDVLCFDEFFVSDIGDAMILAELLEGLFSRGEIGRAHV